MFMSKDRIGEMVFVYEMGDFVIINNVISHELFRQFPSGTRCTVMNGTLRKDENKLRRIAQTLSIEPVSYYQEHHPIILAGQVKPLVYPRADQIKQMHEEWRQRQMTNLLLMTGG